MTPTPMNAPSVQPSALPLVALILGVIGFCFPPLFLVAIILAIVSLVKSGEPAFAARKTLAIITLALSVIYVPIVGILAAIAIPNFIKFQARSKQSECKSNLKMAFMMEKAFQAEKDAFSNSPEEVGFKPEARNRYLYAFTLENQVPATLSTTSTEQLLAAIPGALRENLGVHGTCPDCSFTLACAGNVDNDATIDVWSISSEPRVIRGEPVPAGQPFNEVSDITD